MTEKIDFDRVYKAYDGEMAKCRGKACARSCCGVKLAATWGQGTQSYNTTMEPDEHEYQLRRYGPFDDRISTKEMDLSTDRILNIRFLILGCLGINGECLLRDRKPIACRIFPMDVSTVLPVRTGQCPHALEIAGESNVQTGMQAIRTILGYNDNNKWLTNLQNPIL